MSTGEEDRIARSVALEKTYVHDVYDHMSALQYPEHRNTTPWPKVKKFLNDLEPGSIVCDVGCGNGKYLKVNPSIFKVGSDRCHKLTQIAKDDDNEVLLCDNLTLPFRDESFDAVLSIAVIHHFATKERRVGALRELARVLRIGGRLMITVWAMEQKDRKFETQDVLVQWHHPQVFRTPSLEFSTTATATSEEDFALPCRMLQTHESEDTDSIFSRSSSLQQDGRPGRSRLRLFQSLRSIKTSPSSSSLSSPNETCYSFVKKALQKLSRSNKKEKHRSRAWFLESWASFGKDDHLPATRYDPEGCEEDASIQDLPIELRRMEKEGESFLLDKDTSGQLLEVGLTQKSKSLNDIQSQSQPLTSIGAATPITRSRSRSSIVTADGYKIKIKTAAAETTKEADMLKPKLVKQKKSICEEEFELEKDEERDKPTDMKNLESEIPTLLVRKQKSMNEDILSGRQEEKKNVRQNIRKQISLNDDIIRGKQPRKQPSEDQLSMSVLVSASKSQLKNFRDMVVCSKDGATWYLKSSVTKIIQGIRSKEPVKPDTIPPSSATSPGLRKSNSEDRADEFAFDRRPSHEENSDSSKDNSLQSDASIDSEDSIISVIERVIPKSDQSSPTVLTSPGLHSPKVPLTGVLSHPSSPKISQVMQYPGAKAKALSLPASPRTLVMSPSLKQTFKIPPVAQHSTNGNSSPSTIITPNGKVINGAGNGGSVFLLREATEAAAASSMLKQTFAEDEPVLKLTPIKQVTAARLKSFNDREMLLLSQKLTKLSTKETEPRGADVCEGDDSHKVDTDAEQTLASAVDQSKKADQPARQKSAESASRSELALVKKPSSSAQQVLGLSQQGRISSLDIFNPETEDIDTDSSGVSTPDSVGSVISVRMESSNGTSMTELEQPDLPDDGLLSRDEPKRECSISSLPSASTRSLVTVSELSEMGTGGTKRRSSVAGPVEHPPSAPTRGLSFAGRLQGTSSLEETSTTKRAGATADISKPEKRKAESKSLRKYPSLSKSPEKETWDIECRQRIVDLAENVTERLLAEMNRYKESNVIERERAAYSESDRHADPYLTKLSEDLSHVSRLTEELSADLEAKTTGSSDEDEELETNDSDSPQDPEPAREPDEDGRSSTTLLVKDEKHISGLISSDHSTDAESPGSISGWLDSRRNTIESGYWREHASTAADSGDEVRRSSVTVIYESARKLSQSETPHTRLSIESTDTMDVSERTVSSSEDSMSKRDTTQTETSSGLSVESDFCELDKSVDVSKSTDYSATGVAGSAGGGKPEAASDIKYSASQASLLRPGESIESSDAGDISDRTGSVSDFSRQNTESRSVITQSSASLASWSDCSKDIRFADRRTARCDGRSSSEETNPRAVLTRQQAATQEPLEAKMASTGTSLSGSTSQDSLTSESAGGSIMFHRYYHVFREGELDALIDEFVENLHIISSYYDHTNWCIIAEKVRVWTI